MDQIIIRKSVHAGYFGVGVGVCITWLGFSIRSTYVVFGTIVLLTGIVLLLMYGSRVLNRSEVYILSPKGIQYFEKNAGPVPWDNLTEPRVTQLVGKTYIVFKVYQAAQYVSRLSREEGLLPPGAGSAGVTPLSLTLSGTDAKSDEVLKYIRLQLAAYLKRSQ